MFLSSVTSATVAVTNGSPTTPKNNHASAQNASHPTGIDRGKMSRIDKKRLYGAMVNAGLVLVIAFFIFLINKIFESPISKWPLALLIVFAALLYIFYNHPEAYEKFS